MVARNSATIALAPERARLARRFRASAATLFTFTHRLGGRRRDHDVARIAAAALAPRRSTALYASNDDEEKRLPWFFDPGTYGGVIVLTIFLIVAPLALKSALEASGMDGNQVGVALSGVFVIGGSLLWAFSYVFRVFSKDMTYSTQLKQYEDAVIQKRFEELEDDEVDALLGEIERESAL